ncbi:MAG: hypothetical protein QOE54_2686 [Streptosporangiaceae bacterium]|nr:hypothetical protein [Streptosporangiaceae bacterium]MDX6430320.1 hypothetical protein [Streptosporangiaceae bacterium]
MVEIAVGKRLRSSVCETEIIVVCAPNAPIELSCGGQPMTGESELVGVPAPDFGGGTLLGKRYVDDASGLEVLCTKPGTGELAVAGRKLTIKAPKALPASD